MHPTRKRRLYFVIFLILGVAIAVTLALLALGQNVDLYYTPQQVFQHHLHSDKNFRLGGMVVRGSVKRVPDTLQISFTLTDYHRQIRVQYNGVLPSLFREGQGIVAQGHLNPKGVFVADQVLAKHDATYKPPGIRNKGN